MAKNIEKELGKSENPRKESDKPYSLTNKERYLKKTKETLVEEKKNLSPRKKADALILDIFEEELKRAEQDVQEEKKEKNNPA